MFKKIVLILIVLLSVGLCLKLIDISSIKKHAVGQIIEIYNEDFIYNQKKYRGFSFKIIFERLNH